MLDLGPSKKIRPFQIFLMFAAISVIGIGIGRYEKKIIGPLSVSVDMKFGFIGDYRYRPI